MRRPERRWPVFLLVAFTAVAALYVFTRDTHWERRNLEARARGLEAEYNGHYAAARGYFETALRNNPYDWETHLSLAENLRHRYNDIDQALRHYLFVLTYTPDPLVSAEVNQIVEVLKLMREGALENPADAVEDMFLAVEETSRVVFRQRLTKELIPDAALYYQGWLERGRGQIVFSAIQSLGEGNYDAMVEMAFEDGTSMSMLFHCRLHDIWRLKFSFP